MTNRRMERGCDNPALCCTEDRRETFGKASIRPKHMARRPNGLLAFDVAEGNAGLDMGDKARAVAPHGCNQWREDRDDRPALF